jgi:predicted aspartyl protease
MRIDGSWLVNADGLLRPVLYGEVRAADGSWVEAHFLVDTGADCTALNEDVLRRLNLPSVPLAGQIRGVGGAAAAVRVETRIRFQAQDGTPMNLEGGIAAVTDPDTLELSVLGSDVLHLFAVIADRPQDVVCLLRAPHRYEITSA